MTKASAERHVCPFSHGMRRGGQTGADFNQPDEHVLTAHKREQYQATKPSVMDATTSKITHSSWFVDHPTLSYTKITHSSSKSSILYKSKLQMMFNGNIGTLVSIIWQSCHISFYLQNLVHEPLLCLDVDLLHIANIC